MDKIKTTNILLIILISLMAIQIFSTIELSSDIKKYEKAKLEPELPDELKSAEAKNALLETFKGYYNSKDYDALYTWVDESVRMEYSRDKMIQAIEMLHFQVGEIKEGFFTFFEPVPQVNGIKSFILYYTLKTEKGVATLKINILQQGEEYYKNLGFTIVSK